MTAPKKAAPKADPAKDERKPPAKAPAPAPPANGAPVVEDPWGKAAEVRSAKATPQPGQEASAARKDASAAPQGRGGPWPANGKKYPLALDYMEHPDSARYATWLERLPNAPKGTRSAKALGASLLATEMYYSREVDVHPLVQLSVAAASFGAAYAFAAADARRNAGGQGDHAEAARIKAALGG